MYILVEWLFMKLKMGCSSGSVSCWTSIVGGVYGCTMLIGRDTGREAIRCCRLIGESPARPAP